MLEDISNSMFLRKLYPNGLAFSDCFISTIYFNWEGPSIQISFHLKEKPADNCIPKKWPREFDELKLVIEFIDVDNLEFTNWGTQNNVNVVYLSSLKELSLVGTDCSLKFNSKYIDFKSITPYKVDD